MSQIYTKMIEAGWIAAESSENERERLASLRSYQILDTDPTPNFDRLTALLKKLLNVEFALVSLVDEKRQWFKSACGIDASETPRQEAFCAHAILEKSVLVVLDALQDARFKNNPLVKTDPHIRFYAGYPLINSEGHVLGTLCAIGTKSRDSFEDDHFEVLETLAKTVMDELELHRHAIELKKMVEQRSLYVAQMSHEIRTPLNGVLGMASLLGEELTKPEQVEKLNVLENSAKILTSMVNNILDFSKIEAGEVELDCAAVNLIDLVRSSCSVLEMSAREKGIEIVLEASQQLPTSVLLDEVKIRQILLNLLSNAIKFTETGMVSVFLEYERENSLALLKVKDTGIGIEKEKLKRVFEPFAQAGADIVRKYGGTGLGLHIVKEFVDAMGGTIDVRSELGTGSEFRLAIPATLASSSNVVNEQTEEIENTDFSNLKVCVVEDHPTNQIVVTGMLKRFNVRASCFSSAEEALENLENEHFDLYLTDCQLPGMSGFEFAQKLRTQEEERSLPPSSIIALTANVMQGIREKCQEAGMNEYLPKPVQKEDLRMVLENCQKKVDSRN